MTAPLQELVDEARLAFGAAACSLATLDEDEGELTYRAASGEGADAIVGVRLPVGRGIAGWVAVSGQPLAVSDLRRDARFARDVAESTQYVPTTLLVSPVIGAEGVQGVLSVLDRDTARPGARDDLALADSFTSRAAQLLSTADPVPDELAGLARLVRSADVQRRSRLREQVLRLFDDPP